MIVAIRDGLVEDAAAIAAVHLRAALDGYAGIFPPDAAEPSAEVLASSWSTVLGGAGDVLVAVRDERVVGAVAIVVDDEVPHGLLLKRLYVDPQAWGLGVGSALHDAALDRARAGGHRSINLWVLAANERARRMYERRGWRLVPDRILSHDGLGVVEVLYERRLGGRWSCVIASS